MPDIEKGTVEYLAKLSRILLTEEEITRMKTELGTILSYVSQLNEVETDMTGETFNVLGLKDIRRNDEVKPSLPKEDVLKNGPETSRGFFRVPKII
jgi:aspartyl-tRNA(Asn)/glutamyl-tRNA(Gln) amidotransferase subunit C